MDSKQRILNTAESLFFKYGIKSVSMDDVARELGMSKKTLYQYVETKKDLIDQIMLQILEEEKVFAEEAAQGANDAIAEMMQVAKHITKLLRKLHPGTMYDLQKYYRETWKHLEHYHQQFIYGNIRQNIEKGQQQGLFRLDIDPDIVAKLYVGKTMVIVDESIFPLPQYNREKLFQQHIFYHIRGIATPKGLKLLEKHRK